MRVLSFATVCYIRDDGITPIKDERSSETKNESSSESSGGSECDTGCIVGIVIGGVLAVMVLWLIAATVFIKSRNAKKSPSATLARPTPVEMQITSTETNPNKV